LSICGLYRGGPGEKGEAGKKKKDNWKGRLKVGECAQRSQKVGSPLS